LEHTGGSIGTRIKQVKRSMSWPASQVPKTYGPGPIMINLIRGELAISPENFYTPPLAGEITHV